MIPTVYHEQYQAYFFGPQHPFNPIRYEMVRTLLEAMGCAPDYVQPEPATRADLCAAHDEDFVDYVARASAVDGPRAHRFGLSAGDTPPFDGMDAATRRMAGGTLRAAQMIADGTAPRVLQLGGGLHHAHADRASGFCVYNDLSVAIRHLTGEGLRVAYLDIDVHHGDGVQSIHYDEADVLTISLHETGRTLFPGTGFPREIGAGGGQGFKLNMPFESGTADDSYLAAFERIVPHALAWFQPDALVVQCGADAHACDPLAHLRLTTHAYEQLFRRIVALADEHAGGRALFTLGGGYDLDATPRIWTLLALVLSDEPLPEALPEAWRAQWQERRGPEAASTLHDPPGRFGAPDQHDLDAQNEAQSVQLMNRAAKHWT